MRILLLILLGYLAYKFIISPFMEGLQSPDSKDEIRSGNGKTAHEDEYIDYEEID